MDQLKVRVVFTYRGNVIAHVLTLEARHRTMAFNLCYVFSNDFILNQ